MDRIDPKQRYIEQKRNQMVGTSSTPMPDVPAKPAYEGPNSSEIKAKVVQGFANFANSLVGLAQEYTRTRSEYAITTSVNEAARAINYDIKMLLEDPTQNEDFPGRLEEIYTHAKNHHFEKLDDRERSIAEQRLEPIYTNQFASALDAGIGRYQQELVKQAEDTRDLAKLENDLDSYKSALDSLLNLEQLTPEAYMKEMAEFKKEMAVTDVMNIYAQNGLRTAAEYVDSDTVQSSLKALGFTDVEIFELKERMAANDLVITQRNKANSDIISTGLFKQGIFEFAKALRGQGNFGVEYIEQLGKNGLNGTHAGQLLSLASSLQDYTGKNTTDAENRLWKIIFEGIANGYSKETLSMQIVQESIDADLPADVVSKKLEYVADMDTIISVSDISDQFYKMIKKETDDGKISLGDAFARNTELMKRVEAYYQESMAQGIKPQVSVIQDMVTNFADTLKTEAKTTGSTRTPLEKLFAPMFAGRRGQGEWTYGSVNFASYKKDTDITKVITALNRGDFLSFEGTSLSRYTDNAERVQIEYMNKMDSQWRNSFTVSNIWPGGKLFFTDQEGNEWHLSETGMRNGAVVNEISLMPSNHYKQNQWTHNIEILEKNTIYNFVNRDGTESYYISSGERWYNLKELYAANLIGQASDGKYVLNIGTFEEPKYVPLTTDNIQDVYSKPAQEIIPEESGETIEETQEEELIRNTSTYRKPL